MNIKDVIITELKIFEDNRGKIMHMLHNKKEMVRDPYSKKFQYNWNK